MSKTTKATLWILGVFMALSLAVYFAGCGTDSGGDGGECAKAGDVCTSGKCIEQGSAVGCIPTCTNIGKACDNGVCYYAGTKDVFVCLEAGTKATGDACDTIDDCVEGNQCLTEDKTMACHVVCSVATDCKSTEDCTDTTFGFSVCTAK